MFHRIRHELLVSCAARQFIQLVDGTLVVVDEPVRKCWHNALAIRYPVKTMHTDYHISLSLNSLEDFFYIPIVHLANFLAKFYGSMVLTKIICAVLDICIPIFHRVARETM